MDISGFSSGTRPAESYGNYGSGRPEGVGGRGGSSNDKDLLEELLASLDLELDDFLNDDGTLNAEAVAEALREEDAFAPPGIGQGPGRGRPDVNSEEFQQDFADHFGEEALASILNDDGTVDEAALGDFMAEQGFDIGARASGPPDGISGPPQGGVYGAQLGSDTLATLLEMLSLDNASQDDNDDRANVFDVLTA